MTLRRDFGATAGTVDPAQQGQGLRALARRVFN
jgi:hypothetical protein